MQQVGSKAGVTALLTGRKAADDLLQKVRRILAIGKHEEVAC